MRCYGWISERWEEMVQTTSGLTNFSEKINAWKDPSILLGEME